MTIYFNPRYDSSVFLTAADCGLGKTFCGKEELLEELQLRAGLTRAVPEHADRVIAYMEAMRAALGATGDNDLFYAESFERDDYATAELMLGWRDALVKVGWQGDAPCPSEKIRVLSRIESHFDCPGKADGWRDILLAASERPILKQSDCIEVQCRKGDLEPVLQTLFDNINAHYAEPIVRYLPGTPDDSEEVKASIPGGEIIEFANEYAAHEWIAAQNPGEEDVVAEADGALIGDFLHDMGKPGIGAADVGIGAVMRLLPLGVALFGHPTDIKSLQSYLQSPETPLEKLRNQFEKKDGTKYYRSTTRLLFEHICSNGGFGKAWDEILDGAKYDYDGNLVPEKERKKALKFIGMWEQSNGLPAGQAPRDGVVAFIEGLSRWVNKKMNPDSDLYAQYSALQRNCASMLRLLSSQKEKTIDLDKVCRWAGHICTPVNISSDYARLGSLNIIGDVADIYSKVRHLYWFVSTTENDVAYDYDFLSPGEVKALKEKGVLISEKEQIARLDRTYKIEGLGRCKKVTIVTCRRISGVETVQSALLAELSDSTPKAEGVPVEKTETGVVNIDLGKAAVHTFDTKILNGFSREAESYSSIGNLIQSPVDYLLEYVKGYSQEGIEAVPDMETTGGNVAHAYIEVLGEKAGNDPKAMLRLHNDCFNDLLDGVIADNGLIMCQEENRLEEKNFRIGLQKSVVTWLEIIIENKLDIVSFEYELKADIKGFGCVKAKIDCFLKDPVDGKYVIIDFKNSVYKTHFNLIKENRELQLAVYSKVVEEALGEVKFIGYYVIPRKKLYTPKNTLKSNPAIEEVPKDDSGDVFEMAAKGYAYRWEQLKQGILEEGEGLPLADLDYTKVPGLFVLENEYNTDLKRRAYGGKNITLKGGLK